MVDYEIKGWFIDVRDDIIYVDLAFLNYASALMLILCTRFSIFTKTFLARGKLEFILS